MPKKRKPASEIKDEDVVGRLFPKRGVDKALKIAKVEPKPQVKHPK